VLPGQFRQFFFSSKRELDRKAFITISFLLSNINKNNRNLKLKKVKFTFLFASKPAVRQAGSC
jgi:hypothetical protein